MTGIYLQLTKFILLTNQMTVNLTKENSNAVIFESASRPIGRHRPSPLDDPVYIDEDNTIYPRHYPFDTGGGGGNGDGYGSIPRQSECYSCMSLGYKDNWEHLQYMYMTPKVFTNRCNDPFLQKNLPTVICNTYCASLLEPNLEGGVFLGYKYIRGCIDRILRHGFNQTALQIHRFNQLDLCRSLPRAQLFNPPQSLSMPVFGDVQLCSCYGDKCNGASNSLKLHPSILPIILIPFLSFIYINFYLFIFR